MVAHRVKITIDDLIVPEIVRLLEDGFTVPDVIAFKAGMDSFGVESLRGNTMHIEQTMLTLLIPGRDTRRATTLL